MKTYLATALITLGLTSAAWAATSIDSNGDGMVTLDEVQAVFPEITADSFSAMDVNSDGALDNDEVVAAQEAGLMPKTEG